MNSFVIIENVLKFPCIVIFKFWIVEFWETTPLNQCVWRPFEVTTCNDISGIFICYDDFVHSR